MDRYPSVQPDLHVRNKHDNPLTHSVFARVSEHHCRPDNQLSCDKLLTGKDTARPLKSVMNSLKNETVATGQD